MNRYKILSHSNASKMTNLLNEAAVEGWRVVEFSTTGVGGDRWITALLTRETD